MADNVGIDFRGIPGVIDLLTNCPKEITASLVDAMGQIGRSDIQRFRDEQLSGGSGLKVQNQGFLKAWKYKASDPNKAKSLNQVFLTEYTGWKPALIFQTGGKVVPRNAKALTIVPKGNNGRRKYTQNKIKQMLSSGKATIIKTRNGPVIIATRGMGKNGPMQRKNNAFRSEIIATLKPSIVEKKKVRFYENFESNTPSRNTFMEEAIETALEVAANKYGKVGAVLK